MTTETYNIIRDGQGWTINHDGRREGNYASKESAFESAVAAASNALKDGVGVMITVEPREPGETALGTAS